MWRVSKITEVSQVTLPASLFAQPWGLPEDILDVDLLPWRQLSMLSAGEKEGGGDIYIALTVTENVWGWWGNPDWNYSWWK